MENATAPLTRLGISARELGVVYRVHCFLNVREIGDVDEGVVERGEDTGNAKDELACEGRILVLAQRCQESIAYAHPRGHWGRGRCSP